MSEGSGVLRLEAAPGSGVLGPIDFQISVRSILQELRPGSQPSEWQITQVIEAFREQIPCSCGRLLSERVYEVRNSSIGVVVLIGICCLGRKAVS